MSSLFIIGNGFDLAHSLPTSYEDFRQYLIHNYPGAVKSSPSFNINSTTLPNGSEVYDNEDVVSFLIDIISKAEPYGEKWSDIETSLGHLDFEEYLYEMSVLLDDDEDDNDLWRRANRNEDASEHFYKVTLKVKDLFSEWVNSIDISDARPIKRFRDKIDIENDVFLTFNYTSVLENLYGAEYVFHIHGTQGFEIIIGHGVSREDFENRYVGSEWALSKIHRSLKKDTMEIIKFSKLFFDELLSIKNIYSYGFSFSEVDLPYIKEIIKKLNTENVTWYLSGYDYKETREEYKKVIRACGFKGTFEVFTI
ncbi:bacteriophage abortive infection AbiH family protein [Bacillus cereus]|uniref:bacteriophage abortive infection AbiH family protein n=1 Tax=Bacillus cereus TaxID=1396 RepID=UPI001E614CFB|nr:bacteriophage abortive infection AbiH family protein [Bacillus cereus]MCC2514001.1 bacteriophage abortive infection AbiH family protein [Bacillus cereus]HDW8007356.1 bacteriophage abortive infection AbiH family protein [Bacillus cereus]HDW8012744.1 bacteriophage abortive infection AbiH family protein [Bacillus cereus]HDW8017866.1 bacteriophage abortive infection AbiH family protein [Bacillus cereus]HDW8023267.1 bacteriophage abortive infection AbiH family protein [Bacillus cereus]